MHGEFLGVSGDRRQPSSDSSPADGGGSSRTNPQLLYLSLCERRAFPGQGRLQREADNGLRPGLAWSRRADLKTAVVEEAMSTPAGRRIPGAVARQRRRSRGIYMRHLSTGMVALQYEDRLIDLVGAAPAAQARPLLRKSRHGAHAV